VIGEAGVRLGLDGATSPQAWSFENKCKVAYGVAMIGQRLSRGMAGVKALLGGYANVFLGHGVWWVNLVAQGARHTAPPPPQSDGHSVYLLVDDFSTRDLVGGAQLAVHELAHVMDWQGSFSERWQVALTKYGAEDAVDTLFTPRRWECWAEGLAIWAFGGVDANGAFTTSYLSGEVSKYAGELTARDPQFSLTVQMSQLGKLLEGW
jgi:hypothetical protein